MLYLFKAMFCWVLFKFMELVFVNEVHCLLLVLFLLHYNDHPPFICFYYHKSVLSSFISNFLYYVLVSFVLYIRFESIISFIFVDASILYAL